MSCVTANESLLRYESDVAVLSVHFDNARSFELGIEIGKKLLRGPERPFTLGEVLRLRGVPDAAVIDGIMTPDTNKLSAALERTSELTAGHASEFLMGNNVAFGQLAQLRERESLAYALERDLRFARIKAEAAWAVKDYKSVIAALEQLERHLSPAERKRLDYSRKQLSR